MKWEHVDELRLKNKSTGKEIKEPTGIFYINVPQRARPDTIRSLCQIVNQHPASFIKKELLQKKSAARNH